ncbi:hypothetical protein [uncultured Thiodictyon sp.]|uniref:hypothetical protein n=1 Tax=uncultured Thiodictyon sp. TaxID=1846217 RepID=UPI0026007A37|nr:hypothetical protein [uncultured Thiodictyon sp.]
MTIDDVFDEAIAGRTEETEAIGSYVILNAWKIFRACDAANDFAIQSISDVNEEAVFGCTNRLVWRPASGYRPDRSYCTQGFLSRWDQLDVTAL